ncbi:MAG: 30S ribosomal protein S4 [Candidatus Odinarchaeota archaeon]|nr:30S ribosomal protein S4 [Candidatus Odinarchaeota archaeon]
MGDPKKQRKKYVRPGHPWQKERLIEELELIGKYGLRNKRELWRHKTMLRNVRHNARKLLALTGEEREKIQKELTGRLYRLGILDEDATLDDILSLTVESILERRLQTMVYRLGLAKSIYQARQLITHGHIALDGQVIKAPSFLIPRGFEEKIDYAPGSPLSDPNHPLRKELSSAEKEGEVEENE